MPEIRWAAEAVFVVWTAAKWGAESCWVGMFMAVCTAWIFGVIETTQAANSQMRTAIETSGFVGK